jgi:Fibronectin type III domain
LTSVLGGTIITSTMAVDKSSSALGRAMVILRCAVTLFLGWPWSVHAAQNVTLAWDAERAIGYRLHYGTANGNYTKIQNVGSATTATVSNLTAGQTYFFVVTAYNAFGEGPPSNEVSFRATMDDAPTLSLQKLPNGNVRLSVTGAMGETERFYVSSDLQKWTLLTTAVNKTGTVSVDDPDTQSMDRRFYRTTDTIAVTDTVGFITLPITGASGSGERAFSCLGISLMNPVSYRGKITAFGNRSITDMNAVWTADEFSGADGEFFVEIISGPYAGLMTDILPTNVIGKTLTTYDDLSPLLTGGELYRIRRHRTLGDVFGENNESGLAGGSSAS